MRNTFFNPRLLLIPMLFGLTSLGSFAQAQNCEQDAQGECIDSSSWYDANQLLIRMEDEDASVSWTFGFTDEGDMSLETHQQSADSVKQSRILLVSGELMLSQGLELKKGAEIDALDGPVLQYQLVSQLLTKAFPAGPAKLEGAQSVEVSEAEQSIQVGTSSASGEYEAPWKLKATGKRVSPARISYSLEFAFELEGTVQTAPMSGFWELSENASAIDNDMGVDGWRIYSLGPFMVQNEGGIILDYGAAEKKPDVKTIGELKAWALENTPSK